MIKPISMLSDYVKGKRYQREMKDFVTKQLYDLPNKNVNYYSVFTSKNGTVAALGFPNKVGQYTRSYAVLPNGDHIQTVATRNHKNKKQKNILTDFITRLISHNDGSYEFKNYSIRKDYKGNILGVDSNSGKFRLITEKPAGKPAKIIDITDLFTK